MEVLINKLPVLKVATKVARLGVRSTDHMTTSAPPRDSSAPDRDECCPRIGALPAKSSSAWKKHQKVFQNKTRVSVRGTLHVFAILLRNPAGVQARRLRRNRNARTKTKLHQTTYTRGETREPRQSSTRPRIQTSRTTRGPRGVPRTPLREGQGSHVEGTGWKELAEI